MSSKYDSNYMIKMKNGIIFKFSYAADYGVYYQMLKDEKWSEKNTIYHNCFKYFDVIEYSDTDICVFCQDIAGDIILCRFADDKWTYKTLLHINNGIIMPRHIRNVICNGNLHLFYNTIDNDTHTEILIHQVSKKESQWREWSTPEIVSRLNYYSCPYKIAKDVKSNIIVLNTIFQKVYLLAVKRLHVNQGRWGKEELIHTSLLPYIDFTFFIEDNKEHYLFITQDDMTNKVIYQKRELGMQKNTVLFEHQNIKTCLIMHYKFILCALWVCENNLYGCISTNGGKYFGSPRIYKRFDNVIPSKIYYQQYLNDKDNIEEVQELYYINENGKEKLILDELLEDQAAAEIDSKRIFINNKSKEKRYSERTDKERFEILDIKNEELRKQIKLLKEKNSSLEKKILLKDINKSILEKKLAEKEFEKKSLKYQINLMINKRKK